MVAVLYVSAALRSMPALAASCTAKLRITALARDWLSANPTRLIIRVGQREFVLYRAAALALRSIMIDPKPLVTTL